MLALSISFITIKQVCLRLKMALHKDLRSEQFFKIIQENMHMSGLLGRAFQSGIFPL